MTREEIEARIEKLEELGLVRQYDVWLSPVRREVWVELTTDGKAALANGWI